MAIKLRPATPGDAEVCGRICYEAFHAIATRHNFPPDIPAPEVGIGLLSMVTGHPGFYGIVAERDGKVVGSNFLDERGPIAGVGPVTVNPSVQDSGIGRQLMVDVLERAATRKFAGVRLLQSAYHNRSFCLYASLGFVVREPIAALQGTPPGVEIPGYLVRPATADDLAEASSLCVRVHGHDRGGELADAIGQGTAAIVEHDGRMTGYTTGVAFFGHSVAESNEELKALIGAATEFGGPGLLLPTRNSSLLQWCLDRGLRLVQPLTLMTTGLYNEPDGAWLPSILY